MRAEVGTDESFWLERELIERGAFIEDEFSRGTYETNDFIESFYGSWWYPDAST